jgi:hypothetical protein
VEDDEALLASGGASGFLHGVVTYRLGLKRVLLRAREDATLLLSQGTPSNPPPAAADAGGDAEPAGVERKRSAGEPASDGSAGKRQRQQ